MDFSAMFQTWLNVLTKPNEATFEQERHNPRASLTTAIIWMAIAAVAAAIFSALGSVIGSFIGGSAALLSPELLESADLPPEVAAQLAGFMVQGGVGIGFSFCLILIIPIGFLLSSAIYFGAAKIVGGSGSFEEQSYLLATFIAPLTIVSYVANVIPILGACVSCLIGLYQLVLTYFALKTAHSLTSGSAVLAVVIAIVIWIVLAICLVAVPLFFLGGLIAAGSSGS